MKEIILTQGKTSIVDDADFVWLSKWRWFFDGRYAVRTCTVDGKKTSIRMHAQIMDTPKGLVTDHINRNKLDNRRCNLRICTGSENSINVDMLKRNTTGFKNIYFKKQTGRWFSQVVREKNLVHLGYFENIEDAIKARDLFMETAA